MNHELKTKLQLRKHGLIALLTLLSALPILHAQDAVKPEVQSWPPPLKGAVNGTVTVTTPDFLTVPESVKEGLAKPGAAQFVVAKTAPTVDLAYHHPLPDISANGTGWSAWGDIGVARDGRVYVGTGNHGRNNQLPENGG